MPPQLLDAQQPQEVHKVQQPGMRLPFLIASWCVIIPFLAFKAAVAYIDRSYVAAVILGALAVLATQFHRLTLTSRHKIVALQLSKHDDVRDVGRLAEALEWPDPEIRDIASEALTRLLPRLKASDSALLTARQRACLYQMLNISHATAYADFQVAILKALEQVGDMAAVPYVQQLADIEPMSSRQLKVHKAARECLPYLQIRAEQNQASQTLLRASSDGDTPSDMLLRSAVESETDQMQLLRAGTPEQPQ